jgi:glycosyltransferase involved in cell wall biosynthesis
MTKVVIVNPRAMHFGERHATSIDLSVRDLILHSRFRETTTVIGDPIEKPFDQIAYVERPIGRPDNFYFRMRRLLPVISSLAPDIVSVQEHLFTASHLARRLPVPVLLHMHNPVRKPKHMFERLSRNRAYERLDGLLFVSEDHKHSFQEVWPFVTTPRHVVSNALDMSDWHPVVERKKVIVVVGRAIPEKGIKEAANALAASLPKYPDWKTIFILSAVDSNPDYVANIRTHLSRLGPQAELLVQQPFAIVKAWMEKASIAIVSSLIRETFGRTALEAHAGGAAVISSGSGGLREVSGHHAVYLDRVTPEQISNALD